jgi:hypothetical protein
MEYQHGAVSLLRPNTKNQVAAKRQRQTIILEK